MTTKLPARPNLDHLRTQAKRLLADLRDGKVAAANIFINHLPAARGMTPDRVRRAGLRLADAQSAIPASRASSVGRASRVTSNSCAPSRGTERLPAWKSMRRQCPSR